jgi:hypothetical protein
MSTYRGAVNHSVSLGSLTVFSPQPNGGIVRPTRRTPLADGTVHDEGLFVVLRWSSLASVSAYTTILTVLGLNSATSANVTIYAKSDLLAWTRYNGRAIRPMYGEGLDYRSFPRGIEILVKNLVPL